jgi:glycosyltransferase involved in cell wall biosynthesis
MKETMRLLLLTPALPYPPHQGGALRSLGIIHMLAGMGFDLTLLSFRDDAIASESSPLASLCASITTIPMPERPITARLRDLFLTGRPDIAGRLYHPAMADALRRLLSQFSFDAVIFEGLETAVYLPLAQAHQPDARLIYDAYNAEHRLQSAIAQIEITRPSRLPAALYSAVQARRLARFERQICQAAHGVLAVSDEDADALRAFRADRRVFVIPNGIFTDDYAESSAHQLDLGDHALIFTGKMDYRPNVDAMQWFISAIFPRIRARIPDARLYIVGQKPHPSLQSINDPNIAVTGWVERVQPFLHAGALYVAPLRMGSGTRLKLLEALASGIAIVATPAAAAGLSEEARCAMRIAADEAAFADAVIDLLNQPDLRLEYAERGKAVVRKTYDWRALAPRLFQAFQELGLTQKANSNSTAGAVE